MIPGKTLLLLPLAFVCLAQQPNQQSSTSTNNSNPNNQTKPQPSTQPQPQPQQPQAKPLFGGSLGIKSSDRSKESATLGFNGIDPNGKVDAKMLATTPGAADQAKVKALAAMRPAPEALDAFLKEGELRKK
jgi:hypothetical protein